MTKLARLQLAGFVVAAGLCFLLDESKQLAAVVGVLSASFAEVLTLRRRLQALNPAASQAQFAAALAGGFLFKLAILAGISLSAHALDLFDARVFLLSFLVAFAWGEALTILILIHARPASQSGAHGSAPSQHP